MVNKTNIPTFGRATRTPPTDGGDFDWSKEEPLPKMDKQDVAELIRAEYLNDPLSDTTDADIRKAIAEAEHLSEGERQELVEEFLG